MGAARRFALIATAGAFAALLAVLVVWLIPLWLTAPGISNDRLKAMSDVRTSLVQLCAGIVLLIGLIFTARTLRLNREGHLTDRFRGAVDQLGNSAVDVRIGGIYALERLLRESAIDHQPIVEVLGAFVRNHAQQGGTRTFDPDWQRGSGPPDGLPLLASDVQTALTVLGRRPIREERPTLNLVATDLRRAYLHGLRFSGAVMNDAWLDYSDLGEADLSGCHLKGATFNHTWMRAVDLSGARLKDADFRFAHLHEAKLSSNEISSANFSGAALTRDQEKFIQVHKNG
ncbi:pentapeptide repeat-containing protein [Actinoplanes sp. NPDC004185]